MTLEEQAISSMNYFFLRIATLDKMDDHVIEELQFFLENLERERHTLKPGVKAQISKEVNEGIYFYGKSRDEIAAMLNDASARITGSTMDSITELYLSLLPEQEESE